jgi:release factor glutamine methyltransferase
VADTVWDALADATERMEDASESPQLDAELLLRHVLGVDRLGLLMRYDAVLDADDRARFDALIARRARAEPIAYILGRRGFRNVELSVDERVLVPRPETEQLVEDALAWLRTHAGPRRVVDVGTGSGAIALALASELPSARHDVQIVATERYSAALEVAALNRAQLGLAERVQLVQADLLAGLRGPFDVILANLPYLRPDQTHRSIGSEPKTSLYGGGDGFELYRRLLTQARDVLAPDGLLVGEIDPAQAELAVEYAGAAVGRPARTVLDYAGDARFFRVGDLSSGRTEPLLGSGSEHQR